MKIESSKLNRARDSITRTLSWVCYLVFGVCVCVHETHMIEKRVSRIVIKQRSKHARIHARQKCAQHTHTPSAKATIEFD